MTINTIRTKNHLSIQNKIELLKKPKKQKAINIIQFKKIYKKKKITKMFNKIYFTLYFILQTFYQQ